LFRIIHEGKGIRAEAGGEMLDILFQQEFRSGIPAGLPPDVRAQARIANKTGEISIAAHDSGMIFLPGRKPYVYPAADSFTTRSDHGISRASRADTASGHPPEAGKTFRRNYGPSESSL
jgi:hypothetical protein